jgi:hypothetical protein
MKIEIEIRTCVCHWSLLTQETLDIGIRRPSYNFDWSCIYRMTAPSTATSS